MMMGWKSFYSPPSKTQPQTAWGGRRRKKKKGEEEGGGRFSPFFSDAKKKMRQLFGSSFETLERNVEIFFLKIAGKSCGNSR